MRLVILPGDGIGPEITTATLNVLQAVTERHGLDITLEHDIAGHASLSQFGETVTPALLERVRAADGLLLGPMATFEYPRNINPSAFFRKQLDLYANIRPSRTYEGGRKPVGDFDLVVVRENTEGFYADRNIESGPSELMITPDVVVSLRRITRHCCDRIARSAFELAMRRRQHVTIVHKANVLKMGDGMFMDSCRRAAADFPEVQVDDVIVDAMMAHVVRDPRRYDVIVTTNMFGDILSDLTAELSGSLGLGGSINAGEAHAMAQASHGSAPDIAGKDLANPLSLVLSTAQLLDWHGGRSGQASYQRAAQAIEAAVERAVATGQVTRDLGGSLGTQAAGQALAQLIRADER